MNYNLFTVTRFPPPLMIKPKDDAITNIYVGLVPETMQANRSIVVEDTDIVESLDKNMNSFNTLVSDANSLLKIG